MAVKKGVFKNAVSRGQKTSTGKLRGTESRVSLDDVKDRPHGDTRELNASHVNDLLESIAVVGLIQPLAVDAKGHLLAGGHRREALRLLSSLASGEVEGKESQKFYAEAWNKHFHKGVPVRVFAFEAEADPDQALIIEAAENEKRRDYTPSEVRELADKLIEAGYEDKPGNQRGRSKKLTPTLMSILGKSRSTVKSYLARETKETRQAAIQLETLIKRAEKAVRLIEGHSDFDPNESERIHSALEMLRGISH